MGHFQDQIMLDPTYSNVFKYSNDQVDELDKFKFSKTAHSLATQQPTLSTESNFLVEEVRRFEKT